MTPPAIAPVFFVCAVPLGPAWLEVDESAPLLVRVPVLVVMPVLVFVPVPVCVLLLVSVLLLVLVPLLVSVALPALLLERPRRRGT